MRFSKWLERYAPSPSENRGVANLKLLIWSYILLWLFEGALRKWIVPAFASPLVLVRDPLALWIIFAAIGRNLWRPNLWVITLTLLSCLSFGITLALHIYVPVAIIGLRTILLHLPLIFIIGKVLTRKDVENIGNLLLDLSLPMGILMAIQFAAPSSSFINSGAGIDAMQLEGVDSRVRAPGVFSFITGVSQFYAIVAAFLFYRFVSAEKRSLTVLVGTAIGIILALSVAISRMLTLSVAIVGLAFIISCLRSGIPIRKLMPALAVSAALCAMLLFSETVQAGLDAFAQRWSSAEGAEGSVVSRALEGFMIKGDVVESAGMFGSGLGVGTNMGAKLLTGDLGFMLAEGEWDRIILEMGTPLGIGYILWRCALVGWIGLSCFRALIRRDILPLLILSAAAPSLINGATGAPTLLGYCAISGGLALAACDSRERFAVRDGLLVHVQNRLRSSQTKMIHRAIL